MGSSLLVNKWKWKPGNSSYQPNEEENRMILPTDAEKPFDKIQPHFMLFKNPKQVDPRNNIPHHDQRSISKTQCQHHTKCGDTGSFPTKIWKQTRMSAFTTDFKIVLEILVRALREEKGTEGIQIGNEELKLSMFTGNMILCTATGLNRETVETHTRAW